MRYRVLACDYDGTIATHGLVDPGTLAALGRLRDSGRKLVLVTGRELDQLLGIFPEIHLFDWIVAENGALLYRPETRQAKLLGPAPSEAFVRALAERGVAPVSVGRVIVATWEPHETTVLRTIRDLGLELQVIFNKGAIMILPAGLTKATGLVVALREMGLTTHEAVGVGDAENDHAFLSICECAAAVANALPAVKDRADLVTHGDHGAGVTELIDDLIRNDLADVAARLTRHDLFLGLRDDKSEIRLPSYGSNLAIVGPGGSGKSPMAARFLEQLLARRYQFCIVDPGESRDGMKGTVTLGTGQSRPTADEVLQVLADDRQNAVVNLSGLPVEERPAFLLCLLPRLQEKRAGTGRPHWLIVDQAHQLLPASLEQALPAGLRRCLFITSHPEQMARPALDSFGTIVALGPTAELSIHEFCRAASEKIPVVADADGGLQPGQALVWRRQDAMPPFRIRINS